MILHLTKLGIISMISSNATLLSREKAEQLIDAGLDYLNISFDGFSRESYESFRSGAKFDGTLSNLNTLNEVKILKKVNKPYVDIQWIRNRLNEDEVSEAKRYFQKLTAIDEFHVKSLSLNEHILSWERIQELGKKFLPQTGKIRPQYLDHGSLPRKKGCADLLSPVVMANGDVTICCMDFKGEYTIGNIRKDRFKDLWNSPGYRSLRKLGHHFQLPICKRCPARFR
jgi:radical SAM protein with 4Fe4S-binding SPASM domain